MKYSKILNFKISKQKDSLAFFEYLKQPENERLLLKFVGLRKNQISLKNVNKFIDDFYFREIGLMEKNTKETEVAWFNKQDFFLVEIDRIFGVAYNTRIIAIPSIWPIFGRFFKKKFITFPYNKTLEDRLFILVHELLHFIFYDYIYLKHYFSEEKISSQAVWDFSEVINVLIQNQEEWVKKFGLKTEPYPIHFKLYEDMRIEWDKNRDIDYLISKFLPEKE